VGHERQTMSAGGVASGNVTQHMTAKERLGRVPGLLQYMIPLAGVYFAEYTINLGVNNSQKMNDMNHKTFYVVASFIYQVGVFLSRSSGSIFPLKRLWPLPCMQLGLLVFFCDRGRHTRAVPAGRHSAHLCLR